MTRLTGGLRAARWPWRQEPAARPGPKPTGTDPATRDALTLTGRTAALTAASGRDTATVKRRRARRREASHAGAVRCTWGVDRHPDPDPTHRERRLLGGVEVSDKTRRRR